MAEEKNMLVIGLLLVVILALGYMAFSKPAEQNYYVGPTPPDKETVSVSGEAKATVSPDRGIVDFMVETNKSTAKLSQETNAEIVSRVKQALLQESVSEKSIETTSFSVQPVYQTRYECPDNMPKCEYYDRIYTYEIIGYKTTHQIRVKVESIDRTGDVADRITEEGDNDVRVNSISFDLRDETRNELEKQLLQQASTNAKNKAQRIADGLGARLGKVVMVSENLYYPPVYDYRQKYALDAAGAPEAAAVPTEVFQGQIEVTARVSASFEISG